MAAGQNHIETANPIFAAKRARILESLSLPSTEYIDASPKGSVDAEIRELIDQLNASETCVTTSSCAGRLAIFLEAADAESTAAASASSPDAVGHDACSDATRPAPANLAALKPQATATGTKGAAGRWLFVSHAPIDTHGPSSLSEELAAPQQSLQRLFGLEAGAAADSPAEADAPSQRYVHLKFEPMILHILTANVATAQAILAAGQQAGFRESGVSNVVSACPMVAIRCHGLALDCIIGEVCRKPGNEREVIRPLVTESHLAMLVGVANSRFQKNSQRIVRFAELAKRYARGNQRRTTGGGWEETSARKERMRAEGLQRQRQIRAEVGKPDSETDDLVEGLQLGIET